MFLTKIFGSKSIQAIVVQGIIIPIVGTIVGFEVQKKLINREQKKAKAAEEIEQIDGEVVEVEQLPD